MKPGCLITFEGIDGAGKSTHIADTVATLSAAGLDVVQTREPGGTPLAEAIRKLLLNCSMAAQTELLLMYAARDDHVRQCIQPALAAGRWVVCDRFTDSSYAYQAGGRQMDVTQLDTLTAWVQQTLQPTRTFLFDLDPLTAAQRRAKARAPDRFEQEQVAFFTRVRQTYLDRACQAPDRVMRLDASSSPAVIQGLIRAALGELVRHWRLSP